MSNIQSIEIIRVSLPFETGGPRNGIRPGMGAWTKMESLMVKVNTTDGITGWGEAFGHFVNAGTLATLQGLVAPWFIGKDSRAIAPLIEQAERAMGGFGRNGPVRYAFSAIDIALWDIAGQRAGLPVYRMLGGNQREIGLYASLVRYGDPEPVARISAQAEAAGYARIKLHEATIPNFMASREAVRPETEVALDVGMPWTVAEARAIARAIRDKNFAWFEEPVWPPEDFKGLAQVRAEGITLAAGENIGNLHEFRAFFDAGALDVAQPSVVKIGGISDMRRVWALADAYSVRVVPHCFYWGPGYNASAHVIAAQPRPPLLETAYIIPEDVVNPTFNPKVGKLTLPETPGLGFTPNAAALEKYTIAKAVVN
ncbi:MAG TPA: mandelate racemase/muconate lactonizing enzyme family protein [Burkholderiales bacterium]|jgi:L-alanine-DL-glutamate epimerase-like enolase superfamily enzyme